MKFFPWFFLRFFLGSGLLFAPWFGGLRDPSEAHASQGTKKGGQEKSSTKADAKFPVKRLALVIGSRRGWGGLHPDPLLLYAHRDAERFASVLKQRGQFETRLLLEPTPKAVWKALAQVKEESHKQKLHFLFYYSGHADPKYLRIGSETKDDASSVSIQRLARFFQDLQAPIKIAILDACHAGALIDLFYARTKGRGAGYGLFFEIPIPLTQGTAILTSASSTEKAREIDRLKASLFTHYLVKGLWGAADSDKDGRITIVEAYQYARSQMERALPGSQKPMHYTLFRGQDLYPLTTAYDASVIVPIQAKDQMTLVGGSLLWKWKGKSDIPQILPVMAGSYLLHLQDAKGRCYRLPLAVQKGQRLWLRRQEMKQEACPSGLAKGGDTQDGDLDGEGWSHPFDVGDRGRLEIGLSIGPLAPGPLRPWIGGSFGLALEGGFRLGLLVLGGEREGVGFGQAEVSFGWGWDWRSYRWHGHLGILAGVGLLWSQGADEDIRGVSPSLRYGPSVEFGVLLGGRWWLVAQGFGGVAHTWVRGSGGGSGGGGGGGSGQGEGALLQTAFAFQGRLSLAWRF